MCLGIMPADTLVASCGGLFVSWTKDGTLGRAAASAHTGIIARCTEPHSSQSKKKKVELNFTGSFEIYEE